MKRQIIDMRSRPSFLHDFYGATPGSTEYEVARWLNRRVGSNNDEHFIRSKTINGFVDEISEAGITQAVVVGRDIPGIRIPNDSIQEITLPHNELIGVGSVDPQAQEIGATLKEIERAILTLGLSGINIEPGFGATPMGADDPSLYPVYDACCQLDVPVFLMSGPTSPSLEYTDPAAVGKIARAFPKLSIVCYHGFYPYVNEMIGVAFRHENVYVVPDMYIFLPGGGLYIEAANGFMKDQLLFGTSYPFRAMKQTIDDFLRLGLKEEALDPVLYQNAKRLLRLEVI
ncbi:amidohydrolase family protein [Candidatus Methylospira mobilis]|uniref:amidohydrolase family protein n=1 Tax=Candidatus Methylospira mobilis TaxID=1808979 RepID=UPI0028E275DA|nr:amidohydrolase family protein [Candidatus Methylospira mobilis]WNV03587.1 amidohydrolase family protein [Candidatus Methylospira mobilis]